MCVRHACCSVLQCVAVCCEYEFSMVLCLLWWFQCVAVCRSVAQCGRHAFQKPKDGALLCNFLFDEKFYYLIVSYSLLRTAPWSTHHIYFKQNE